MGGTPISELYIVYRKLAQICKQQGLQIVRNLIGPYITSLEMQGCSITLLKLDDPAMGCTSQNAKLALGDSIITLATQKRHYEL